MRSHIEEVLEEELKRLDQTIRGYRRELQKLPKGSVQKKKIRGRSYPYLAVRDGDKVRYRYLGQLSGEKLEELNKAIEMRRRYQLLLKQAGENKDRVERMLRGRKRAV